MIRRWLLRRHVKPREAADKEVARRQLALARQLHGGIAATAARIRRSTDENGFGAAVEWSMQPKTR